MVAAERGENIIAAATTSSDTKRNASIGSSIILDLDLDHLTDPEEANRLKPDGPEQHELTHVLPKQHVHVFRIDHRQRYGERRRKREQDVTREAAVCRMDAHLAADLESLADDVREVVENLGQITPRIALNQHGGDEEPHVEERQAVGHPVQ